jgi:hypothetical protein
MNLKIENNPSLMPSGLAFWHRIVDSTGQVVGYAIDAAMAQSFADAARNAARISRIESYLHAWEQSRPAI